MICVKCGVEKDHSEFPRKNAKRRHRVCKTCKCIYNRTWYAKNKARHLEDVHRNQRRYRREKRALINELKNRPCADCGGIFPPFVMDFDHRDPSSKLMGLSESVGRAWADADILAEAAKCDVVCANCHRIRTFGRQTRRD